MIKKIRPPKIAAELGINERLVMHILEQYGQKEYKRTNQLSPEEVSYILAYLLQHEEEYEDNRVETFGKDVFIIQWGDYDYYVELIDKGQKLDREFLISLCSNCGWRFQNHEDAEKKVNHLISKDYTCNTYMDINIEDYPWLPLNEYFDNNE